MWASRCERAATALVEGGPPKDIPGSGVEADRSWYWRERGWVLSAPADPAIAERLSWLNIF
jgi:hypothetical protein